MTKHVTNHAASEAESKARFLLGRAQFVLRDELAPTRRRLVGVEQDPVRAALLDERAHGAEIGLALLRPRSTPRNPTRIQSEEAPTSSPAGALGEQRLEVIESPFG